MNKKTQKIILSLSFFFLLTFWCFPVFALEITYPQLPGGISLPPKPKLYEYVRYIYAFSIFITGFIALGILIYGGFRYLISAGNPVAMAAARDQIGAGIAGMLILLGSYIILVTINPELVGLKEIKFEPKTIPPYTYSTRTPLPDQKDVGFQIPMGKIIERVILSSDEKFSIRNEKFANDTEFREEIEKTIQKIIDLTGEFNFELFELKNLINQCNCGSSVCVGNCFAQSCNLNCNLSAIYSKANQIKNSPILSALEKKEEELSDYKNEVEKRNTSLHKAIFLATIFFEDVLDYFSFAVEKQETENIFNRQVKIETLPEWADIKIFVKTPDGRIIADPSTLYFWKKYKEMDDAINFASNAIGSLAASSCPNTSLPGGTICVPSNPGAFIWPADGKITMGYLATDPPYSPTHPHKGIDIGNAVGSPIRAVANGKIKKAYKGCSPVPYNPDSNQMLKDPSARCGGGLGNHIVIEHENFDPHIGTIYTIYAHLDEVKVNVGDIVKQGQQIGTMDTTGYVTGPHLHFVVSQDPNGNIHMDPAIYLPGNGNTVCGPGGGGGGGTCEVITDPNNPCSVEKLRPYFGAQAENASRICNAESGGEIWSFNRGCENPNNPTGDYSVGLFQINLYRTGRCNKVNIPENQIFRQISELQCEVIDQNKALECAYAYGLGNPDVNSKKAAEIFGGVSWCPWSTACPLYCNLCSDWHSCP